MKITIEPTDNFGMINGVKCREWKGITEKGIECFVMVAFIACEKTIDPSEFDPRLKPVRVVNPEAN